MSAPISSSRAGTLGIGAAAPQTAIAVRVDFLAKIRNSRPFWPGGRLPAWDCKGAAQSGQRQPDRFGLGYAVPRPRPMPAPGLEGTDATTAYRVRSAGRSTRHHGDHHGARARPVSRSTRYADLPPAGRRRRRHRHARPRPGNADNSRPAGAGGKPRRRGRDDRWNLRRASKARWLCRRSFPIAAGHSGGVLRFSKAAIHERADPAGGSLHEPGLSACRRGPTRHGRRWANS